MDFQLEYVLPQFIISLFTNIQDPSIKSIFEIIMQQRVRGVVKIILFFIADLEGQLLGSNFEQSINLFSQIKKKPLKNNFIDSVLQIKLNPNFYQFSKMEYKFVNDQL